MTARYLNVGCGSRFNRSWTNIDIQPSDADVQACNLLNGLPFENGSFDAVYHSHVLEHIKRSDVDHFLSECFRVLKPNGVLRVVVPDLENIARLYLQSINEMDEGNTEWESMHEWMILEMYDQVARDASGGEMKKFILKSNAKIQAFIKSRWGIEAEMLLNPIKKQNDKTLKNKTRTIKQESLRRPAHRMRNSIGRLNIKKWLARLLLGGEYERYQQDKLIVDFQNSGELHKWMYDRYSLKRLLLNAGFENFRVMEAWESNIENWKQQKLDLDESGNVFKPDSIFVEATRPLA